MHATTHLEIELIASHRRSLLQDVANIGVGGLEQGQQGDLELCGEVVPEPCMHPQDCTFSNHLSQHHITLHSSKMHALLPTFLFRS